VASSVPYRFHARQRAAAAGVGGSMTSSMRSGRDAGSRAAGNVGRRGRRLRALHVAFWFWLGRAALFHTPAGLMATA
jgi:hypothetical protein